MGEYRTKSHWQLVWQQFKRHRLALLGGGILLLLYTLAAFAGFFSPYDPNFYTLSPVYRYAPPTPIHFRDPATGRLTRPFVYGLKKTLDLNTFVEKYTEDRTRRYPIRFFVRTPDHPYTIFKVFRSDLRLFGLGEKATAEGARLYLLGSDNFGRDLWSRMVYGAQVSLTIGILAVLVALVLGLLLGGLSGFYQGTRIRLSLPLFARATWRYLKAGEARGPGRVLRVFGRGILLVLSLVFWLGLAAGLLYGLVVLTGYSGAGERVIEALLMVPAALWLLSRGLLVPFTFDPDDLVMRLVEILAAIPGLFLLVTLRSVFPSDIDPLMTFYIVVAILSLIGWGGLARTVRGMVLSLREMDYVTAAKALGVPEFLLILRHILPATASYTIVYASLAIPGFILAESGLSFIGFGITEPYTSWGLLLKAAQDGGFASFADRPWVLAPGFAIFLAVLTWNFVGDGLRDAFDPRRRR